MPAMRAGERAKSDRHVWRSKGRRSALRNAAAASLRHNRITKRPARLSLIGAHAERRVSLHMLDRAIAFANRELDIAIGDVLLQINEALSLRTR